MSQFTTQENILLFQAYWEYVLLKCNSPFSCHDFGEDSQWALVTAGFRVDHFHSGDWPQVLLGALSSLPRGSPCSLISVCLYLQLKLCSELMKYVFNFLSFMLVVWLFIHLHSCHGDSYSYIHQVTWGLSTDSINGHLQSVKHAVKTQDRCIIRSAQVTV